MTPEDVVAIRDKKLLPVRSLTWFHPPPISDAGNRFVLSSGPHLRLHSEPAWARYSCWTWCTPFAQLKTTPDVIRQDLAMEPEGIRKQFLGWLDKDVGKTVGHFDKWRTSLKDLVQQAKNKNYDEVLKEGEEVRGLYPDYVYPANPYEFMAEADLAKEISKPPPPY